MKPTSINIVRVSNETDRQYTFFFSLSVVFLSIINESKSICQAKITITKIYTEQETFNWNESKNCFWYLIFLFGWNPNQKRDLTIIGLRYGKSRKKKPFFMLAVVSRTQNIWLKNIVPSQSTTSICVLWSSHIYIYSWCVRVRKEISHFCQRFLILITDFCDVFLHHLLILDVFCTNAITKKRNWVWIGC